jgi:hypothetical protein
MIKMIFSTALVIHSLIHLMGFAKEWDLAPTGRFSGKTLFPLSKNVSKIIGILWLLTCILLIAATVAYYSAKDWFWVIAVAGLLISQALIIIYWQNAKWGTLANILVLTVAILSAAQVSFHTTVKQEVRNLISVSSGKQNKITVGMIADLPPVIQTWLKKARILGEEIPLYVHVTQKGSLRKDLNSKWMPFEAEQYFTIDPPGFVWRASIHTGLSIDIVGRDKYENGKGNMLIKAASLFPIANSIGKEID